MSIKVVGIDIAKNLFQVCVLSADGQILSNRKEKRDKLLDTVRQFQEQPAIAMESCATSHHLERIFQELGHRVALIPALHVKPFVERQDLKAIRRVRKRLMENRTALANQIRGLAAEYGVVFPLSIKSLRSHLPLAIEDAEHQLSHAMRSLLQTLHCNFINISDEVDKVTQSITRLSHNIQGMKQLRISLVLVRF